MEDKKNFEKSICHTEDTKDINWENLSLLRSSKSKNSSFEYKFNDILRGLTTVFVICIGEKLWIS